MTDSLISLEEAAELLGYSPSGLRKIVNRTRAGKSAATIRFFQIGNGPIKIKREWVDDFIAANSVMPVQRRPKTEPQHLRRAA